MPQTITTPRPPSPWPGSQHAERQRWQLDGVRSLPEAAALLRRLATELAEAQAAGWILTEPVRGGHLVAARASRRTRTQVGRVPLPETALPSPRWRLRLVDEQPQPGEAVLELARASETPVLAASGDGLRQLAGPQLSAALLAEVARQVGAAELGNRPWGLARGRVGPAVDLVAAGSALRVHALHRGVLVRFTETLAFLHGADGASNLSAAAAAYERLARAAEAMAAAGGYLVAVDDGFLLVRYGPP